MTGSENRAFQLQCRLLVNRLHQVGIDVQGHGRARVPKLGLNVFDVLALFDQQACIGVAQIVKTDMAELRSF